MSAADSTERSVLSAAQLQLVRRTAERAAAQVGLPPAQASTSDLAVSPVDATPAHPAAPPVGTDSTTVFVVGQEDTAAAMGHPDRSMAVLGSPRISLWFEIATSPLMPSPDSGVQHVGVGILTHHLGRAVEGEEVAVQVRVDDVRGRSIVFACSAYVGDRLVALGTHHRVILRPAEGDR